MYERINIVVIGVNLCDESIAGSIRVRNLFDSFEDLSQFRLTNLFRIKTGKNVIRRLDLFIQLTFSTHMTFIFILRKLRLKKNILYIYGPPSITNIVFIIIARLLGYKIVFDIVENYFTIYYYKSLKARISNIIRKVFIKRMPLFTDCCIVISTKLVGELKKIAKNRFIVQHIPISVRISEFTHNNDTDTKGDIIVFHYGGTFGEKDGLDYLIKAFNKVAIQRTKIFLSLSGKASVTDYKRIEDLICELPSRDRIKNLGCLNRSEYLKALSFADVLCVTRDNTKYSNFGFPFKLGEYLASGRAVLASEVGDLNLYLSNRVDVHFVKPENEADLMNAINELSVNTEYRDRLGENARLCAQKKFDSFIISSEFKEYILTLCR